MISRYKKPVRQKPDLKIAPNPSLWRKAWSLQMFFSPGRGTGGGIHLDPGVQDTVTLPDKSGKQVSERNSGTGLLDLP